MPEKENLTKTYKVVLDSQVKSHNHKNLSICSLTSENNNLKICILKSYGSLVICQQALFTNRKYIRKC